MIKLKLKIDIKKLSFFVSTTKPDIQFHNNKINVSKIDAYINLKSLITGKPEIHKLYIISNEIDVNEIKSVVKYFKPSNFKKFFIKSSRKRDNFV